MKDRDSQQNGVRTPQETTPEQRAEFQGRIGGRPSVQDESGFAGIGRPDDQAAVTPPEQSSTTMGAFDVGRKPPDEEPGAKLLVPEDRRGDQGREVPGFNHDGYAQAEIIYPLPDSISDDDRRDG